ncbi:MAG: alginate O-acetyltransferase AlgX-related protein [Bacillota bacterium]|jgi:hypothetical protein
MTGMNINKHGKVDDTVKAPIVRNPGLKKLLIIVFSVFLGVVCLLTIGLNIKTLASDLLNIRSSGAEATIADFEADFNEGLAGKECFIDIFGGVVNLADMDFVRDTDYSYSVIKDNHGNLQFMTFEAELPEIVRSIDQYTALDVPIIYVQPPKKYIEGYTEFPAAINDQSDENADEIMEFLQEKNIPALDLRSAASEELDPDTIFYSTDHHWTTQTAFWAVGKTVDFVRETVGLDLDPRKYYMNIDNWTQELHEDAFLGSQGRRVGRLYGGVDDFTLIYPKFETDYYITGLKDDAEAEGSFNEAILEDGLLDFSDSVWTNHYAGYWGGDYSKVTVDNRLNDDGSNILLIKDSYGLPYSAFMSTMVDRMTIIDLRYFSIGDLSAYVAGSDFDLVILMYE